MLFEGNHHTLHLVVTVWLLGSMCVCVCVVGCSRVSEFVHILPSARVAEIMMYTLITGKPSQLARLCCL